VHASRNWTASVSKDILQSGPMNKANAPPDEYPLKLGNIAELVILAVVEFPLPLMLDAEVVLESPKEEGGTEVGDGFAHTEEEI